MLWGGFFCLFVSFLWELDPKGGQWAGPSLRVCLYLFVEGHLVWFKEQRRKHHNALTGESSNIFLLSTYCVFSIGVRGTGLATLFF